MLNINKNIIVHSVANTSDKIFTLIRDLAGDAKTVTFADVYNRCSSKGYKRDQIDVCIDEYEELNVWQVNNNRTKLTFV